MSVKSLKNTSASVRQRLLDRAKRDRRPFNELLQYYAMERFLYRLSRSPHASHFVLKGALMLRVWRAPEFRPTMDIDLLGQTRNEEVNVLTQIRDVLAVEVDPDGLVFDRDSVRTERIAEDAVYQGIRARFLATLDSARISMQIDIGFGDVVYPEPEEADLPVLLDFPVPRLRCYSRESAIAEKFEAMVKLGELNSRMKDFYDLWLLSRQFDFDGSRLAEAIKLTFNHRGTPISEMVPAFTKAFATAKQAQWAAFHKRLQHDNAPLSFANVVTLVDEFLSPVVSSIVTSTKTPARWTASGSWLKGRLSESNG